MKGIADQLAAEIAQHIHPERRQNEAAYWAVRDQLLDQYRDQWIGFANGMVIASVKSPVAVFHAAVVAEHPWDGFAIRGTLTLGFFDHSSPSQRQ